MRRTWRGISANMALPISMLPRTRPSSGERTLPRSSTESYTSKSRYVLMMISKEYIVKKWCLHERRSAISEGLTRDQEFILPIIFDDSWPMGIPKDVHYIDANKKSAAEVAVLLAEKLGVMRYSTKASSAPPPKSTSWIGHVVFDYESYCGRYIIGDDVYAFETVWTAASQGRIHVYNDGKNVNGVAVAYGIRDYTDLPDASLLDFSSRVRTAQVGDTVVYRNNAALCAALKIEEVTVRKGATPPKLRFSYAINREGNADFQPFGMLD